jgi:hypothetical protein
LTVLPGLTPQAAAYSDDERDSCAAGEVLMLLRGYYPDAATDADQHDSVQAQLCHVARVVALQHHEACPVIDARARLAEIAMLRARLEAEETVLWEIIMAGCTYAGW